MNKKTINVLIISIIAIIVVVLILYFLHQKAVSGSWPLKCNLENNGDSDITLKLYLNESEVSISPEDLKKGDKKTITLQAKNPRTGKEYTLDEVKSISIYMPDSGNIVFESVNIPSYKTVRAKNLAGFAPLNTNVGNTWTDPGYYVLIFD